MTLDWRGEDVFNTAVKAITAGLDEFGGRCETSAKGSLRPGRGVVTGTYRRSIHYGPPTYNFGGDDVPPSPGSPERAGRGGGAAVKGANISITFGSGMRYARRLEDLYNVIQGAHNQVAPLLPDILERQAVRAGLR